MKNRILWMGCFLFVGCSALGGLSAQSTIPTLPKTKDKESEQRTESKSPMAEKERTAVVKAEAELLTRLTELGKARAAEEKANADVTEAEETLTEAKKSEDQAKIDLATKELEQAHAARERAKETLQTTQTLHDQAREQYRLARKNLSLALEQKGNGEKSNAGTSVEEILDQKERVDQAALKAALAQRRLATLREQQQTLKKRLVEIEETQKKINASLDDRKKESLSEKEVSRLLEAKKNLFEESKRIEEQLQTVEEEILLGEAQQRLEQEAVSHEQDEFDQLTNRIYIGVGIFLGILVLLFVARILAVRTIRNPDHLYTTKKMFALAYVLVIFLGLFLLVAYRFSNLLTLLGLAVAGLTIALQEIVASFAAWILIRTTRCYTVRDWIQLGDQFGEVVDIGLTRTTILQSEPFSPAQGQRGGSLTGGLTMFMNSTLFKKPLVNYTHGFPFIWCTLRYTVTFESDWQRARDVLREILANDEEVEKSAKEAATFFQEMAGDFTIEVNSTQPIVLTWTAGSGVELTVRYLAHPRRRVAAIDRINSKILAAFQKEVDVEFAYSTVRSVGGPDAAVLASLGGAGSEE